MHLEILVEDISGKVALDILIPKIVDERHTYNVHPYKGIGRLPKNLNPASDPNKRILLDQLPRLLRGFGKTFESYPDNYPAAVILICDLDDKQIKVFLLELQGILDSCNPKPETRFCISVEEGEAWLLGDVPAIKLAYPKAKDSVLNAYKNDSICGTWELLANAVYPGGLQNIKSKNWTIIGAEKSEWAKNIAPNMDVDSNQSPSFNFFLSNVRKLTND